MNISDPIADCLTRIRNAQMADHDDVAMPFSKLKNGVVTILKREGYIQDFATEGTGTKKTLRVRLKYTAYREPVIKGIRRVSSPGLRRYVSASEVPRVLGGMGVAILSTSSGLLVDREARKLNVGGEVMCHVW